MDRWKTTVGLLGAAALAAAVAPELQGLAPPQEPEVVAAASPDPSAPIAAAPQPEREAAWISLLPPASTLRRHAHTPTYCQGWVPGGPTQIEVTLAIRAGACGEAVEALSAAMDVSPDHCSLYGAVWRCFQEQHRRPLERKRSIGSVEELIPYLAHLEGDRSVREQQQLDHPALATVPRPYQPAPDGLEKLLREFDADPRHRGAILDLYGPGTTADRIGDLLTLELRIATALAALPAEERTAQVEEVLARRMYVLGRSLSGPIGKLLADESPALFAELHREVEGLLEAATPGVRDAFETGRQ